MRLPVDFHTHHGAFGAYGSFTLGNAGAGGGFNIHDGRAPAKGEVHVGVLRPSGALFLPFSSPSAADLSAFAGEGAGREPPRVSIVAPEFVERELGWGTDTWRTEDLSFALATPFGKVPDPRNAGWDALSPHILPSVWAELSLDNSRSDEPAMLVAGLAPGDAGVASLDLPGLVGLDLQGRFGMATSSDNGAKAYAGFSLMDCFGPDLVPRPPHRLGTSWGLCWPVPAGGKLSVAFALGWYHAGPATAGISTVYGYTRLWKDLGEVLAAAVERTEASWETARSRDRDLDALSPERRWLLSHATRGYVGNSQLLSTPDGSPVYVVNEGEYCMMNTLDLSVDQVFFEGRFFPWATREILDLMAARYSFLDRLKVPGDTILHEGGVSFCHDMGVRNRFSEAGTSSYEVADLEGCFSHMAFEEVCNWVVAAAHHLHSSQDGNWLQRNRERLEPLRASLERREHPEPRMRKGVPGTDSARCGSGTEITTYDSLDPSLAQARENLYTTVKLWAAYLALERLSRAAGIPGEGAAEGALRVAAAIESWPGEDDVLAALRDGRRGSAILPAVECLVHPHAWGDSDAVSPRGRFGGMVRVLERHLDAVLEFGLCRFADGGWRLSSTSDNSWLSKIFLVQRVAERVFSRPPDRRADAAHVSWLSPGSAPWGFTDQIASAKGIGSKYYPRGVTAILFLDP
jgi:hypothetical protein